MLIADCSLFDGVARSCRPHAVGQGGTLSVKKSPTLARVGAFGSVRACKGRVWQGMKGPRSDELG